MNGAQLYERHKELYRDYIPGTTNNSHKIDLLKFYSERPRELRNQNYNWLTTMFPTAPVQNYFISASGANERMNTTPVSPIITKRYFREYEFPADQPPW